VTIAVEIAVKRATRTAPPFTLDAAFEVPAHGVTALLGPSGSGKTTVLRALAGLDRHAGCIRFDREIWQDGSHFVPPHRRAIGYVAQGTSLLPHLSVAQNLDYAERRAPAGHSVRQDIVVRTGIAALLDRMPARLSGGEARRAAIARALVGRPRLLLLDEPLSGLDGEARAAMLAQLAGLLHDSRCPVIYVTHSADEAECLADRTLTIEGGRVAVACAPRSIRPAAGISGG